MVVISAKMAALRLLAKKQFFSGELRKKLQQRGYSLQEIEEALCWLEELGYLNDQEHLQRFVAMKSCKGYGIEAIRYQLREKCKPEISCSMKQETEAIAAFLAKRYPNWQGVEYKQRQSLFSILRRRGFSIEAIEKVCGHNLDDIL